MPQSPIIVDFTSVVNSARGVPGTATSRVQSVKLINVVFDGIALAIDSLDARDKIGVWGDIETGEGMLYRAISKDLQRMVTFDFDPDSHPAALENEVAEVIDRFQPDTLSIPLSWHDLSVAQSANRRRLRALLARLLEIGKQGSIDIVWDIHATSTPPVDNITDTLKIMEWLQDRGLDPTAWVLDLPIYDRFAMMLVARAHIDGRSDIQVIFRSEGHPNNPATSRETVMAEVAALGANSPMLVGASYFGEELKLVSGGESDTASTSQVIADRLIDLSKHPNRELATT